MVKKKSPNSLSFSKRPAYRAVFILLALLIAAAVFAGGGAAAQNVTTAESAGYTSAAIVLNAGQLEHVLVETDYTEVSLGLDITMNAPITIDRKVALYLNGHTITAAPDKSFFLIGQNGDLTLTDPLGNGKLKGNGVVSDAGGAITIIGGKFTLAGNAQITGCSTNGSGGAVLNIGGTVTMKDNAKITGCSANANGASVSGFDTGMYNFDSSTFDLDGADLTLNGGGGIYSFGGTVTMQNNAAITGCKTDGSGGGIYSTYSIIMSDNAKITGCSAANGGGVAFSAGSATLTPSGAVQITGNTLTDGTTADNLNTNIPAGTICLDKTLTEGAIIGITSAPGYVFTSGKKATKDMAAFFIPDDAQYRVKFNLGDKELELVEPGVEIGDTRYVTVSEAAAAAKTGDTIRLLADSEENSPIIICGDAESFPKGVILDLNGHTLTGTGSDPVITITNSGILELKDDTGKGIITQLKGYSGPKKGGGVYTSGIFFMTSGTITGCSATENGAGVYFEEGTLTLGGTVDITGNNIGSSANNVYITSGRTITLHPDYPLKDGAAIGICMQSPGVFTTGGQGSETTKNCFSYDGYGYVIDAKDGELALTQAVAEINGKRYSSVQDAVDAAYDRDTVRMIADSREDIIIEDKHPIILDLNGHILTGTGDEAVIYIDEKNELELKDSSKADCYYKTALGSRWTRATEREWRQAGSKTLDDITCPEDFNGAIIKLTGGIVTGGTGVLVSGVGHVGGGVCCKGYFDMYSGNIAGCCADDQGGGVYNENNNCHIYGGSIAGCSTDKFGGGIYLGADLYIYNGSIVGCSAGINGGGIFAKADEVYMGGGSITGCSAGYNGGGIYLRITDFSMYGGQITECSADNCGGGVFIYGRTFKYGGIIENCRADEDDAVGSDSAKIIYISHSITVKTEGNGKVNVPAKAAAGSTVALAPAAGDGWQFKGFESSEVTVKNSRFTMPDKDVVVTAVFKEKTKDTFAVSVSTSGQGTASASQSSAVKYAAVKLTAVPADGYKFKEWVGSSGVSVANDRFIMPESDAAVKAVFEELPADEYAVIVTSDGHGTAQASQTSAKEGADVTLSASPDDGWKFKGWQSADADISGSKFTMPAKTVSVKAVFEEDGLVVLSGSISAEGENALSGPVKLTLSYGPGVINTLQTTDGAFRFESDIRNYALEATHFNLAAEYNGKKITVPVDASRGSVSGIKLVFPKEDVSSGIVIEENSPEIAVSGLNEAVMSLAEDGKKVELILYAREMERTEGAFTAVLAGIQKSYPRVTADSSLMPLAVDLTKVADGMPEAVNELDGVLELCVVYLPDNMENIHVFRCHNGVITELTKSDSKADGTFRVANDGVYLYASRFSEYVIVPVMKTPAPSSSGGSSQDTGSGNYSEYPRTADGSGGLISFGTSKNVKSVELPKGVKGDVVLNLKTDEKGPEGAETALVFEINIPNYPTGTEATVNFELTAASIESAGYTPADVVLMHKGADGWESLPTTYESAGTKVKYAAVTTSFSPFAVVYSEGAAQPAAAPTADAAVEETAAPVVVEETAVATAVPTAVKTTAAPIATAAAKSAAPLAGVIAGAMAAAVICRRK